MIDLFEARNTLAGFKDPFQKDCVIRVSTWCAKLTFGGGWTYTGTVEFQNGDTKGEQKFKGESLANVLQKMEVFVQSL